MHSVSSLNPLFWEADKKCGLPQPRERTAAQRRANTSGFLVCWCSGMTGQISSETKCWRKKKVKVGIIEECYCDFKALNLKHLCSETQPNYMFLFIPVEE